MLYQPPSLLHSLNNQWDCVHLSIVTHTNQQRVLFILMYCLKLAHLICCLFVLLDGRLTSTTTTSTEEFLQVCIWHHTIHTSSPPLLRVGIKNGPKATQCNHASPNRDQMQKVYPLGDHSPHLTELWHMLPSPNGQKTAGHYLGIDRINLGR